MKTLVIALCAASCLPAQAVAIASGTGNITAPGDDPGFANIGGANGASAIYLGNQWVLTAAHAAPALPSSASFGGTSYPTQAGTWQRLTNNGTGGMTALTDIVLFRLASDPGLSDLTVRTAAMVAGDDLIMIGGGRDRAAATTHWDITVVPGDDNDIWTEVTPPPPADATGFKPTGTKTIRWGENEVLTGSVDVNAGFGDVRSFNTEFNQGAFTHEAQGLNGDSGGGVFYKNGGTWELAGMMHVIATFENQPSVTAVFGNQTYAADLSFYESQITTITSIPEARSLAALIGGLALLGLRRR